MKVQVLEWNARNECLKLVMRTRELLSKGLLLEVVRNNTVGVVSHFQSMIY